MMKSMSSQIDGWPSGIIDVIPKNNVIQNDVILRFYIIFQTSRVPAERWHRLGFTGFTALVATGAAILGIGQVEGAALWADLLALPRPTTTI